MSNMLSINGLRKTYYPRGGLFGTSEAPVVALDGVSLGIRRGEIFGLVGESGSGKTTTGRLVLKLERADAGSIRLNGEDITAFGGKTLKRFRRDVQMIFQDPYQSLNPHLSVKESVEEPLVIHHLGNAAERHDKVCDILDTVGLNPAHQYLRRYPHQLSGGQRQRVAIARAMVLDPKVVVADEPTSMLDASISIQIFNILKSIRIRHQVTFLFITHSLAAAHYLCDRVAVIYRGHIVETGDAKTVIRDPRHPYTRALIDALPAFGHGWGKNHGTLLDVPRTETAPCGCPFYPRCGIGVSNHCDKEKPDLLPLDGEHAAACFYI